MMVLTAYKRQNQENTQSFLHDKERHMLYIISPVLVKVKINYNFPNLYWNS